ncbi:sugar transferase [candidate division KSB1 bacterium]|nr:sugar transferase [candidate division KSB1 bacterium]
MVNKIINRFLDIIIAVAVMIIFAPLLIIIAILLWQKIGFPVIFKHSRTGHFEKMFTIYKFRTMIQKMDTKGVLLPDQDRLTKLGRFLRSTSFDELPSLWNVLKGDMSIVGPRPLLPEYFSLYTKEQNRRHEVKPGITGWAQVNGRNAVSWEQKFKLDVWYVDHQSFCLDLKILFLTIFKVFKREGISQNGHATMEKFKGSST